MVKDPLPSIEQIVRLLAGISLIVFWYLVYVYLWSRITRWKKSRSTASDFRSRRRLSRLVIHLVCALLGVATTLFLLNVYVYYGFGYQPDIYRKGDRSRPWVVLTFDDGPHPDYTPRILDILDRHGVPATFFLVGAHVEKYPDIAKEIVARGHEVGNHTWSHVNVPTTPTPELYEEIIRTSLIILDTTGVYPEYIRPPRGMYDGRFRRIADLLGARVVLWTLSSMDWQEGRSAESIVRRVVSLVRPGDILLFHDSGALIGREGASREQTVRSLEGVITGIRAKGLEFVPLSRFLSGVEGEPTAPPELASETPP